MQAEVLNTGEDHQLRMGDGQMVVKEDGTHTRRNPTEQPARSLVTLTPRRVLDCSEELSQLYQITAAPTRQQFAELLARYDTEVVS